MQQRKTQGAILSCPAAGRVHGCCWVIGYLKGPQGFREDSQVGEDKGNSETVFILFPPQATPRVIKQNDMSLTAQITGIGDFQKKEMKLS